MGCDFLVSASTVGAGAGTLAVASRVDDAQRRSRGRGFSNAALGDVAPLVTVRCAQEALRDERTLLRHHRAGLYRREERIGRFTRRFLALEHVRCRSRPGQHQPGRGAQPQHRRPSFRCRWSTAVRGASQPRWTPVSVVTAALLREPRPPSLWPASEWVRSAASILLVSKIRATRARRVISTRDASVSGRRDSQTCTRGQRCPHFFRAPSRESRLCAPGLDL